VFVDTSTVLFDSYRLPLLSCAQLGHLNVVWSPYVAAEVARVSTREYVRRVLRTVAAEPTSRDQIVELVNDAMNRVRQSIDSAIDALEQYWYSPDPNVRRQVETLAAGSPLEDEKDVPILAGALASGCRYLLTTDTKAFPHGVEWQNIRFWHPDTFLTAFFMNFPDGYVDVRLDLEDIVQTSPLLPR